MPKKSIVPLLLGAGAAVLLLSRSSSDGGDTVDADCSDVGTSGGNVAGVDYLEHITAGGDPDEPMPMLIVFHSRGAGAKNAAKFTGLKVPVRVIRPNGIVKLSGGSSSWFTLPSRTSNQEEYERQMGDVANKLGSFVAQIQQCRPTTGAPVVTGSSEGAHVTYLIASQRPGLVRGAVSLLGWLPEPYWSSEMAPTIAMHGTADTTVPYERTKKFWDAMKARGANISTTTLPTGHSVTSEMDNNWRSAVNHMLGIES